LLVSHGKHLQNFGRNLDLRPSAYYEPRMESEVLEILGRHRGEKIRAIGSLHSWSSAPVSDGVVINLRHLNQVEVQCDHDAGWVTVGAGCQIKALLAHLKRHGQTLPSVGLITEQTIAGAISTGTHGSGRHSLSHYVDVVRLARYDEATGMSIIEQIEGGDALQAARCSLGGLGVILSLRVRCRRQYSIEEHWQEYRTLDPVLAAEREFPLQQFFLVPWRWTFMAQHRRENVLPRSALAWLYRAYWFLFIDVGLHLLVLFTVRLAASWRFVQFLYRHIIPRTVIRGWRVTDESSAMLVMEHELFRHIEIELFVRSQHLPEALDYVRRVLATAADVPETSSSGSQGPDQFRSIRGRYCHHYPICIRRVLADDTLISMTAGDEGAWYAISLISYARPVDRDGFQQVARFLAETMAAQFGARPHWGKWCPLSAETLISLYPQFEDFRTACVSRDSQGVFRNTWLSSLFAKVGSQLV
jgi:FAD/FMN-containing dehydrogenase